MPPEPKDEVERPKPCIACVKSLAASVSDGKCVHADNSQSGRCKRCSTRGPKCVDVPEVILPFANELYRVKQLLAANEQLLWEADLPTSSAEKKRKTSPEQMNHLAQQVRDLRNSAKHATWGWKSALQRYEDGVFRSMEMLLAQASSDNARLPHENLELMEQRYDNLLKHCQQLEKEAADHSRQIESSKAMFKEIKNANLSAAAEDEKWQTRTQELQQVNEQLARDHDQVKAANIELTDDNSRLKEKVSAAEHEYEGVIGLLQAQGLDSDDLKSKNAQQGNTIKELMAENKTYKDENANIIESNSRLNKELTELKVAHKNLGEENVKLFGSLTNATKEIRELKGHLTTIQPKYQDLQGKFTEQNNKSAALEKQASQLKAELQGLKEAQAAQAGNVNFNNSNNNDDRPIKIPSSPEPPALAIAPTGVANSVLTFRNWHRQRQRAHAFFDEILDDMHPEPKE